jgi:hypothetical protein
MEIKVGWSYQNKTEKMLSDLFFPNGLPLKLDYEKIITKEIDQNFMGSMRKVVKNSYPFERVNVTKERLKEITSTLTKENKERFIKQVVGIMNNSPYSLDQQEVADIYDNGNMDLKYSLFPDTMKPLTLDDIHYIFDEKPNKSLLRSVVNELDLNSSDRVLLMKYVSAGKFEFFRVLGKQGIQFSKDELKIIVNHPNFIRVTTTGTMASKDTNDIINRRAVILYQDACDSEIFTTMISSIKDQHTKDVFLRSFKRKSVEEKFKNQPEILLWLKLQ